MDDHVKSFKRPIEITQTPIREAYVYFFMSLSSSYKE